MSFRELLHDEFQRRRARNPRYSLRAFARALRLDHSSLSQILRGKRRLTPRVIRRLGKRIDADASLIELHCAEENDRALLRLIGSPRFHADSRWLATLLGIPLDDVNIAIQRLVRTRAVLMKSKQEWEIVNAESGGAVADRRA